MPDFTLDEWLQQAQSSNMVERWQAVEQLAQFPEDRAIQALITALQHPDHSTRWRAAQALGELHKVEAVPALIQAVADRRTVVSQVAAQALGKIGDLRAVETLVQHHQTTTLVDFGTKVIPSLIPFLSDSRAGRRLCAANALVKLGWQPSDTTLQIQLLIALQHWEQCLPLGSQIIVPLRQILDDSQWLIQLGAARTLAMKYDVMGIQKILLLTQHTDGLACRKAERLLGLMPRYRDAYEKTMDKLNALSTGIEDDHIDLIPSEIVLALLTRLLDDPDFQEQAVMILERLNTAAAQQILAQWRK